MTLVELTVAGAIMGIMALGLASMMEGQSKQMKILSQKQELAGLKTLMLTQLSKESVCTWQLKDRTINVTGVPTPAAPSPSVVALANNTIYSGPNAASPAFATSNAMLPGNLSGIRVETVAFKNIYSTGHPNEYQGVFEVVIDSNSVGQAVRPIQIPAIFRTYVGDPPNAARIETCLTSSSAPLGDAQPRNNDTDYIALSDGFVVVTVSASPASRVVYVNGLVNGVPMATAGAVDYTNPATPSPNLQSFNMPVPKGKTWRVDVFRGSPSQVTTRWIPLGL